MVTVYAADKIYVAGIPDGYPIEYFDQEKDEYDGILPQLLYRIGKEQDLEFYYIDPSAKDRREELAKEKQVDLICTYGLGEERKKDLELAGSLHVFRYQDGDREIDIELSYTKTMPSDAVETLKQAVAELDPKMVEELTQTYRYKNEASREAFRKYFYYFAAAFGLMAVLILVLLIRLRRQKELVRRKQYSDEITGRDNFEMWQNRYRDRIVNENRNHYALIQMSTGIEFVNRIYGYQEAEEALKMAGDLLAEQLDLSCEAFARLNGYEFIMFIQYREREEIQKRVMEMEHLLNHKFSEKRYVLDFQAGIYQLQTKDSDPMESVKYSELMMRYAVEHHLDFVFYDVEIEKESIADYSLEHEAVRGLMKNEFLMYLQPIMDLQQERIVGAEALVRWNNPLRGLMKPGEFMHAMKKKSLAAKMNLMLFEQGCRYLQMLGPGYETIKLLFNFDSQNIADEEFVSSILQLTERYHVRPEQIIIQLNQMVEITQQKRFKEVIQKLREYGFNICLAGLELDRVFNEFFMSGVGMIKLRRELVNNIETESGAVILKNLLNICRELNLQTFCVGIEKESQRQFLKENGCELATGHYFYYPLTCEAFVALLRKKNMIEIMN